jgi:Mrp family chromosome partitioning ATPase
MSVIDKAFAKAYSRRSRAESRTNAQAGSDSVQSLPDVTVHPQAEQSAIVWIDEIADQYLRRDPGQRPGQRPGERPPLDTQGSSGARHVADINAAGAVEPRPRGGKGVGPKNGPAPAVTRTGVPPEITPSQTGDAELPGWTRMDTRFWEPNDATAIAAADSGETLTRQTYFTDSVIVQESYDPVAASPLTDNLPEKKPGHGLAEQEPASEPRVFTDESSEAAGIDLRVDTASPALGRPFGLPAWMPTGRSTGVDAAAASTRAKRGFPALDEDRPAAASKPFAAVWEVDSFEFPSTVVSLFGDPGLIKSIGFPLDRAVCEGLQTLLVTSERSGAGRTTVATGIAISAAMAGLRVALIDATSPKSIESLSLADSLNLDIHNGWLDAIRGGRSVSEIAIHSIEDQFTVLPLLSSTQSSDPTVEEFRRVIRQLRQGFDLVVIDGPSFLESSRALLPAPGFSASADPSAEPVIDAAIVVRDARLADTEATFRVMESLKRRGVTGLGVVENFV